MLLVSEKLASMLIESPQLPALLTEASLYVLLSAPILRAGPQDGQGFRELGHPSPATLSTANYDFFGSSSFFKFSIVGVASLTSLNKILLIFTT